MVQQNVEAKDFKARMDLKIYMPYAPLDNKSLHSFSRDSNVMQ